jgi:hypothetical protein
VSIHTREIENVSAQSQQHDSAPPLRCIYCEGRRGDPKFSLEHIWPQALGGAACPKIFQTDQVCRRCNSLAGQWIDGAFLKSWFLLNEAGINAHLYLDPKKPGASPLFYMGFDEEIPLPKEEVCERWIGPAGAHIYHIHQRDDERWYGFAGGDFLHRQRLDAGRAYIVLTSPTAYWVLASLLSFVAYFPEAKRRCLTTVMGLPDTINVLAPDAGPISASEATEIAFIRGRPDDRAHHHRLSISVDFSDRFLAKLGVGLAHTILGPAVSASPYVGELRGAMWCQDPEERSRFQMRGTGFWRDGSTDDLFSKFAGWPGAWTILLSPQRQGFAVVLFTPSGRPMTIMLSDDPSLWPPHIGSEYGAGLFYVVVPERESAFGPIPLLDFVSHKLGRRRHADLLTLEAMKTDRSLLPPMRPSAAPTP